MSILAQCTPACGKVVAQPLPQPPPPMPSPSGSSSSQILTGNWSASVNTTIADPGNGSLRWNTASQYDATTIAVAKINSDNNDVSIGLKAAISGDILYIQRQNDSSIWMKYRITAAPVDNGTWIRYTVTPIDHAGGPFGGNQGLLIAVN